MLQYRTMRFKLSLVTIFLVFLLLPIARVVAGSSDIVEVVGEDTESRLSQAVANQQLAFDDLTLQSVANRCQGAQIILRDIRLKNDKATRQRISLYGSIQKDLQSIKFRMLRQGSDASETDLLYGKLQQLIDRFTVQSNKYGTTLDDLVAVSCQEKPEYFSAGLILARVQQAKLLDITLKINRVVENKTTFDQLKRRLTL